MPGRGATPRGGRTDQPLPHSRLGADPIALQLDGDLHLGEYLVDNTRISSLDKSYHGNFDYVVKHLTA
jgi:hypothetical protein